MNISIDIKGLKSLLELTPASQNVMLVGKHGIGKSEILTHYFSRKRMKVVTLFLGQMSDPGDLIGLPTKDEATGKTDFLPPYWFPTDGEPIVLFLDELNRARPEVLQTVMDLTLNRKLAGKPLPNGSRIISAVNDGEEYQLTDLDPALVSRFNIYTFRPTVQEWLLWASKAGIDERIINFISSNPTMLENSGEAPDAGLDKSPDRRAWTHVSEVIKGIAPLNNLHKKIIAGIVGLKAANEFMKLVALDNTLTGTEVLLHFGKHKAAIGKMKLHEYSTLNESIFRCVETGDYGNDPAAAAQALEAYCQLMLSKKKSEAFAHWVSLYTSNNYPNMALFLVSHAPTLLARMQTFISEL